MITDLLNARVGAASCALGALAANLANPHPSLFLVLTWALNLVLWTSLSVEAARRRRRLRELGLDL